MNNNKKLRKKKKNACLRSPRQQVERKREKMKKKEEDADVIFCKTPITSTYQTHRNPQAPTTIFICMNFFILLLFIKIKNKKLWWV